MVLSLSVSLGPRNTSCADHGTEYKMGTQSIILQGGTHNIDASSQEGVEGVSSCIRTAVLRNSWTLRILCACMYNRSLGGASRWISVSWVRDRLTPSRSQSRRLVETTRCRIDDRRADCNSPLP